MTSRHDGTDILRALSPEEAATPPWGGLSSFGFAVPGSGLDEATLRARVKASLPDGPTSASASYLGHSPRSFWFPSEDDQEKRREALNEARADRFRALQGLVKEFSLVPLSTAPTDPPPAPLDDPCTRPLDARCSYVFLRVASGRRTVGLLCGECLSFDESAIASLCVLQLEEEMRVRHGAESVTVLPCSRIGEGRDEPWGDDGFGDGWGKLLYGWENRASDGKNFDEVGKYALDRASCYFGAMRQGYLSDERDELERVVLADGARGTVDRAQAALVSDVALRQLVGCSLSELRALPTWKVRQLRPLDNAAAPSGVRRPVDGPVVAAPTGSPTQWQCPRLPPGLVRKSLPPMTHRCGGVVFFAGLCRNCVRAAVVASAAPQALASISAQEQHSYDVEAEVKAAIKEILKTSYENDEDHCRRVLNQASAAVRADRRVALAAWPHMGIKYVAPSWKRDKAFVLEAIESEQCRGYSTDRRIQHVDASLRADKDVMLAAVRSTGTAFRYASAELRDDKELLMTALCNGYKRGDQIFGAASERLRDDKQIVICAYENDSRMNIQLVSERLQQDPDVLALRAEPCCFCQSYYCKNGYCMR
jgi:hypothetical protein